MSLIDTGVSELSNACLFKVQQMCYTNSDFRNANVFWNRKIKQRY